MRYVIEGLAAVAMLALAPVVFGQDATIQVKQQQIEGPGCAKPPVWQNTSPAAPCSDAELQDWIADARHWRDERRIRAGLSGAEYQRPELGWTQADYVQPQMMVHDRFFYDPQAQRYTVSRYLEDLEQRYGGIDSVLVWHTYPNMGVDDRSQFDLFGDLPGGTAAVRDFVAAFHARGIKVLFPIMLWDQGTRPSASNVRKPTVRGDRSDASATGAHDAETIVRELREVGADGINGDTLDGMPQTFQLASLQQHHPLALQPELGPAADEMLNWNTSSWGYWDYSFVPVISRFKWLEPRHMVNISNRFAHDHTDDLQHAFFNGVGFESWENVWGIWNGLTPHDAEALRRIAAIERFAKAYLVSPAWQPFVATHQAGVFASAWPQGERGTLWTLINRNHYDVNGSELTVPHQPGARYFDLWHGAELTARTEQDRDVLSFPLERDGYGAVLALPAGQAPAGSQSAADLTRLLGAMKQSSATPLTDFSKQWTSLPQQPVAIAPTAAPAAAPAGMSHIPAADFVFRVNGIEIEGENDEGVDVQYPGETSARRYHEQRLQIASFWIDTTPVTNAEFAKFIAATRYHPRDDHNFLRDWPKGRVPDGWDDKPVTWVSLEDARAYAAWAGKRLPHEWEWQYAAQGTDGRDYPWGNTFVAGNVPTPDSGRVMLPASDVHAHPAGASPFGVQDLVGNVWQWTDEWQDAHTRAAIVRGGSHYQPAGSRWYFPQARKLSQHGKYLLMAPSLDRSGAIGFRCVMDDPESVNVAH